MEKTRIGVVGASGRLGGIIARKATQAGFEITAISGRAANAGKADDACSGLAAVIIAAPLTSAAFHRHALAAGSHVIDVGILEDTVDGALSLDGLAKEQNKTLVTMAGLAPGLTGLLALYMAQRFPSAARIDVVLVQNTRGTAGERGVRDMLDMLTDPDLSPVTRLDALDLPPLHCAGAQFFGLPSPERGRLGPDAEGPAIYYHTIFDRPMMNRAIRALRILRRYIPKAYEIVRDRAAAGKAGRSTPSDESMTLGAVAISEDDVTLGHETLDLTSDYEATAQVALTFTELAVAGDLPPGAGHPATFSDYAKLRLRTFS